MRDVEIRSLREDSRPAFVLEDVNSAEFIHPKVPPGSPSWALRNVKDFRIWQSGTIPDTYLAQAEQKML